VSLVSFGTLVAEMEAKAMLSPANGFVLKSVQAMWDYLKVHIPPMTDDRRDNFICH
jgi:hypothetical protein